MIWGTGSGVGGGGWLVVFRWGGGWHCGTVDLVELNIPFSSIGETTWLSHN